MQPPARGCYRGRRFVDCTGGFPAIVRATANDYAEHLRQLQCARCDSAFVRGQALGVYAAYVLLGRDADGLAVVRRVVPQPTEMTWLARSAPGSWPGRPVGRGG